MAASPERKDNPDAPAPARPRWPGEGLGLLGLAWLAGYFLHLSWRKWPDPIVDVGAQWYAAWRVSHGSIPYHDFVWNYGPLSLVFNGLLFKCVGPGMMVLATANLVVYGLILSLGYLAFRMAWGRLAAFAATAVFISVFSFSHLTSVGNYNFVIPYANEATHGMLLMLVTVFIAVRWCGGKSGAWAFLLGLCGGLAAVLKPEFMLAGAVLGAGAMLWRRLTRQAVSVAEGGLALAGVVLPTLLFTAWFARVESWRAAFVDSCQAWWLVLVNSRNPALIYQPAFTGAGHPWRNLSLELQATLCAVGVIGAAWVAGWIVNRPWKGSVRAPAVLGVAVLASGIRVDGGWFEIGRCLPGLMLLALAVVVIRVRRELRETGSARAGSLMALALVLLAGAMMARMPLRARVYHFGFFQAAFAGMVAAAAMVSEVPRWTGTGRWGRCLTAWGCLAALALGCAAIAEKSRGIRAEQTQPVATGRDRFYAFNEEVDETGLLVNWAVEQLQAIPPGATLQVMPEGVMINYLSRHVRPLPDIGPDEDGYVRQLGRSPPDYVILITRDLREFGVTQFGMPGHPGEKTLNWLRGNYALVSSRAGHFKGATLLRRKTER